MKINILKYSHVFVAFLAMCYSIYMGLTGHKEEAQYSAHWPGTILLFAIAIEQMRRRTE